MPLRVHPTPCVIRPPDNLTDVRPDLRLAAADLARAYAAGDKLITDDALRAIGAGLWAALVAADPALPERFAADRAAAGNYLLPLVIESAAPAVRLLPWETLHHPDYGFLGRDPRFTLSRRLHGAAPAHPPDRGPLRAIMFTCLPDDLDPERERLDVEEQQALALAAWGAAVAEGRVELEMPDDGRFSTFAALVERVDPHVVFLFTHGEFRRPPPYDKGASPHAVVLFEGEDGRGDPVDETRLAELFAGRGTRCVVLAACQSGMGDSADLTAGLAWAIHRAGVPHVIGMRESILVTAAMQFNTRFGALALAGERVDAALQRARAAITQPLRDAPALGDAALREQSLGQWPLPALVAGDPAAPLVDWNFTPRPPAPSPTAGGLGGVFLPARFIGRRAELRRRKGPLLRGERPALLITGPGGQGKTALAGKIAADWERGGGGLAVWSAREPWEPFWLRLAALAGPGAAEAVERETDEIARAAALLGMLLRANGGRFLLFLDNLEDIQDEATLALTDDRAAALVAAALALGPAGLRLLATSRARPPDWPAEAWLPLSPIGYGDFLQIALAERAPAAFWRGDTEGNVRRPRRIHEALNGNGRGLLFVVANLNALGGDAAAEETFLAALAAATEESRVDMALDALLDRLSAAERAYLARLATYDAPAPREGLLRLGLDLPEAGEAIDRLLDLSLLERADDDARQCPVYLAAPPATARLAARHGLGPDDDALRAAAGYQAWVYQYEDRTVGQAIALHRALARAGEQAAADRLALDSIVPTLHLAGQYRMLLDDWLPALRESADSPTRAAGLGWSGRSHHALGDYDAALESYEQSLTIRHVLGDRDDVGITINNIASIALARNDNNLAQLKMEEALAIFEEIGDLKNQGMVLNNLSQIYDAHGEYDTALTYLEQSLAIRRAIGDRHGIGVSLNNISQVYQARGDYKVALDYLQQSLVIRQEIGDHNGEGTVLNNISLIYKIRGDYDTALTYLEQSLAIRRAIGDRAGEGTTLNNISQIYDARGDYATALTYLEQALAISRAIGDQASEGTALNGMGTNSQARGDYTNALTYLEQSLVISRAIGDRAGEGATLNNMAGIYRTRGHYDTALAYLEQSLAISRAIGDRAGEGTTLNNISQIYKAHGDYDTALTYLEQSLAISRAIGDRAGEGTTLNNISQIYKARGDYDAALPFLEGALAIQRQIGDRVGEGTTLNNISQIWDARGSYDTALHLLMEALTIQREVGDRKSEAATLNNIAQVHFARSEYDTALIYLKESLSIQQAIGDRSIEGATLSNISLIYHAHGDFDSMLSYSRQSLDVMKEMGDSRGQARTLNNLSAIAFSNNDHNTALDYLQQALNIQMSLDDVIGMCPTLFNMGYIHWQNGRQREAVECWIKVYNIATQVGLAEALQNLEQLAGQIGLQGGLAGWQKLSLEFGGE